MYLHGYYKENMIEINKNTSINSKNRTFFKVLNYFWLFFLVFPTFVTSVGALKVRVTCLPFKKLSSSGRKNAAAQQPTNKANFNNQNLIID